MSINATQSLSGEHLVHGQIVVCNPEKSLEKIDIQGVGNYKIMHQVTMQPVILFIELYF